jgi:hypothetical protein
MAGLLDFAARFGTEERCIEHFSRASGCPPTASCLAGQDRIPAQTPGRATAAQRAPLLRQLQLSGAELDAAAAGGWKRGAVETLRPKPARQSSTLLVRAEG